MGFSVAVLIRSKNSAEILPQTLKALFSQTDCQFELHVVDSESTDNTQEILKLYPCHIQSIHAHEYFPGKVLNEAIKEMQSDIIVFLNSDTVLLTPHALLHLLNAFQNPHVQAAFGRQLPRPDAESWVKRDYQVSFPASPEAPAWIPLSLPLAAMRKDAWKQHPFYTAAWGSEDTEWGNWAKNSGIKIDYVPEALVMHSHNYTLRQLYGRRFIEGEADSFIYSSSYNILNMLLDWSKATLRDFFFYVRCKDLWGIPRIPILRFVYYWAYLQGHRLGTQRRHTNNHDASQGQNVILTHYEK